MRAGSPVPRPQRIVTIDSPSTIIVLIKGQLTPFTLGWQREMKKDTNTFHGPPWTPGSVQRPGSAATKSSRPQLCERRIFDLATFQQAAPEEPFTAYHQVP